MRRQDKLARRLLKFATSRPSRRTVVELPFHPGGVSAAGGVVWVGGDGKIVRIPAAETPTTLMPIPVDLPSAVYHIAFPGGVWVSERHPNRVTKIC